ncbi:hypothetical protein KGF47_18175 [Clostridioides sp. ZZV13-5731]|uniref:helix-turn-helix domain-containing protein n=1 Tax=Clostridioides sp. ZZV13-5731 TaxID=2811485 RepID=UPI001D10E805|nr:hypothetical protein [Clostridioides sp. ZZV13-5731]
MISNEEIYDMGFKIGRTKVLSVSKLLQLNTACRMQDRNAIMGILLPAYISIGVNFPEELFENLENIEFMLAYQLGLTAGNAKENATFSGFISLADASERYNIPQATLLSAIKRGAFEDGEDCKKIGRDWIFKVSALEEKYNDKE